MTDKLRELAAWMRGINGHCATELLAILDAEGDGGAVAGEYTDAHAKDAVIAALNPLLSAGTFEAPDWAIRVAAICMDCNVAEHTHPARSGVVSDEDVEECWMVLTGRAGSIAHEKDHECMMDIERKAVRAALEHFARRTP